MVHQAGKRWYILWQTVVRKLASGYKCVAVVNLVFIGNPGVGKTHLVIALGIEACHQGYRTLFISCHELLLRLRSAFEKGTVDRVLKRYAKYDLLIIDELCEAFHNSSYGKLNIM